MLSRISFRPIGEIHLLEPIGSAVRFRAPSLRSKHHGLVSPTLRSGIGRKVGRAITRTASRRPYAAALMSINPMDRV
jgi:hypothetical protein